MSLPKVLFTLCLASIFAFAIFQLSLSRYQTQALVPGCESKTADGLIDASDTVACWENQVVNPPLAMSEPVITQAKVLGASASQKWIEIDLSDQKIIAHDGDKIFLESLISSGLWNKTPVGEYQIWYKIASTKMEGGIKGQKSYYYLPNVPYAIFFKGSYGIHGTYWHSNFGTPRSHGCVNAPTPIAEKLFYWADPQLPQGKRSVRSSAENPGTRVVVHE